MTGKCQTLLIAETGSKFSRGLEPWLTERGYEVRTAESVKDAIMTLQNEKVHVLVMDVCLAQGLGYESISIIKGLSRNLPIIITTEENNPAQESSIRQKGIFYYHVESFGMEELMLAITNAMTRSFH
jgi:DNA-binding NtrC family response regulator